LAQPGKTAKEFGDTFVKDVTISFLFMLTVMKVSFSYTVCQKSFSN